MGKPILLDSQIPQSLLRSQTQSVLISMRKTHKVQSPLTYLEHSTFLLLQVLTEPWSCDEDHGTHYSRRPQSSSGRTDMPCDVTEKIKGKKGEIRIVNIKWIVNEKY